MQAARSGQFSTNAVASFHAHAHDAMSGTFAQDRHRNLPRPLRSCISERAPNISVLSSTVAEGQARSSSASGAYRTPQWAEFSDCVRDVSPSNRTSEESVRSDSSDGGDDAASHRPLAPRESPPPVSTSSTTRERSVVNRLEALSRSSVVDASAVAEALREAERVLQHPSHAVQAHNAPPPRERDNEEEAAHAHRLDRAAVAKWKATETHDRSGTADQRHTSGHRDRAPPHAQHAHVSPHRDRKSEKHTGQRSRHQHANAYWPWPPLDGALYPGNAGLPVPSHSSTINSAPPPSGHQTDASMQWYDLYYAWMLYYQQLYASQILQQEQAHQQQRLEKEMRKHRHRHGHARKHASDEVSSHAQLTAASRISHVDIPAMRDDSAEDQQRSHRDGNHKRSTSHRGTKKELEAAHVDHSTADITAEAETLRAELRRMEEAYASLRARVSAADAAGGSAASRSVRESPPAARPRSTALAQRSAADSVAQQEQKPANTWQALAERHRNPSMPAREQPRRGALRQRPSWK